MHNSDEANGFAEWGGYMEAKQAKLIQQYNSTSGKTVQISNIFTGVAIFVNGLTNPNADDLKLIMASHGGTYHLYQNSTTTHIIASNLPNVKIKHLGSLPIVKPAWITESLALSKLLDYKRYLLYTNQSTTQPRIEFPIVAKPTKTASDEGFLQEFYGNSRLHLIATLGAEFKQLVGQLRDKSDGVFPGKEKLLAMKGKNVAVSSQNRPKTVIMHIDMDCFFVSVGLKSHPELRGKPVAITHARSGTTNPNRPNQKANRETEFALYRQHLPDGATVDRTMMIDENASMSEIASCSYEARKCGVKNGMFMGTAMKLCPELISLPYDFQGYKDVSNHLYNTIASYTLDIEAVSCDELYVDISKLLQESDMQVNEWASHIRAEIQNITGCPCSTGFGANRLQARLATRKAKPCGQYYLQSHDIEQYMAEIPLIDLPGVGRATLAKLKGLGLNTCGDVHNVPLKNLQQELGNKTGETLYQQSKGIDKRPLNFHHERKSVSAEVNYGIRFKSLAEFHTFLEELSGEVCNRLRDTGMLAKCIMLKLMVRAAEAPEETAKFLGHGFCDNVNKSVTLGTAICDSNVVFRETKHIYDKLNVKFVDLRGVGIQLSKLEKAGSNVSGVSRAMSNFLQQSSSHVDITSREIKPNLPSLKKDNKSLKALKAKESILNKFTEKNVKPEIISNIPQIDERVLMELPAEIRSEIIKDYELVMSRNPEMFRQEKSPEIKSEEIVVCQKSLFSDVSLSDVKVAVQHWIEAEDNPAQLDVLMLAKHLKQLAIERKIDMLKCFFNFLHRKFAKLNCNWHFAYYKMVGQVQDGMLLAYGVNLMVTSKFECCES